MLIAENIRITTMQESFLEQQQDTFTHYEMAVLTFLAFLMAVIVIIAGWSGILLLTEATDGGGPLGWLVRFIFSCYRQIEAIST